MEQLLGLVGFGFVSAATPGPNNILLWATGAQFGLRGAIPHALGTAAGLGAMALAASAGIGTLVTTVPALEFLLKVAGSLYLLYLAYRVSGAGAIRRGSVARPMTFLQAAAFQALNPKAWIFALGAVTTFRPPEWHSFVGGVAVACVMAIVIIPSALLWAAGGGAMAGLLDDPVRRRVVGIGLGLLLAGSVVLVWI